MKKNVKQYNFIKGMILSVLLFMLSTNTFGVDFKVGEFYFNILSEADLTVELTAPTYRGYYQGDIVIPEFVTYNKKKYRVVSLDEKSFRGCLFLNSLTIPRSVITSKASFSDCIRMTSVTLHCKKVTNYMFYCRSSLKKVVIGEEVESIGEKAFSGCTNLTSLIIPNGVKSMGKEAFSCCSNLNSLTISNGVELIGEYAFEHCVSLTSVTIPGSVKTIGNGAFWGCENLLTLVLSEGIQTIGSTAFAHCKKLTSLVIPYSIKNWGTKPFEYCSLNRVTVPKHYTTYDIYIFGGAMIIKGEYVEHPKGDSTVKNEMTLSDNVFNVDGEKDISQFEKTKREAEKGNVVAKEKLMDMYLRGIGTQKDINKALDLMVELALKGAVDDQYKLLTHKTKLLSASNKNVLCAKLVKTYDAEQSKIDVNQDWAAFICELAATSGNVHAMYEMGQRKMEGKGCYKDIEKAIRYYEQAANKGNQEAMLALGEIYLNSLLGHFDEPKAIEWLTKAYESGNRVAKEKLGYFYINGIHVKKNKKLGKKILAE